MLRLTSLLWVICLVLSLIFEESQQAPIEIVLPASLGGGSFVPGAKPKTASVPADTSVKTSVVNVTAAQPSGVTGAAASVVGGTPAPVVTINETDTDQEPGELPEGMEVEEDEAAELIEEMAAMKAIGVTKSSTDLQREASDEASDVERELKRVLNKVSPAKPAVAVKKANPVQTLIVNAAKN